jgi:iron complex outermembrane receptor protein
MRIKSEALSATIGFSGLALASASLAAGSDAAQNGATLEEIVVTAEHRSEDLQKVPVSVSVRTGEELIQQGRYSLQDILQDVPGVVGGLTQDTVGGKSDNMGSGITIRGKSANGLARGSVISTPPAIAVYVDNVYEGVGGSYDISRVEVLRGPQGTLYGRSATAGVVNIHTQDPKLADWGGDASVEVGNYNLQHYTGAVNIPVGDTLAIRVAANRYQRNGYVDAQGQKTATTDGRVKLLYKPNESLSLLLGAQLENNSFNTGGTQYLLNVPNDPDTLVATSALTGKGETRHRQYWAELDWNLGPMVLTYLPAYRTFTQNTLLITAGPLPGGLSQPDLTPKDNFLTQELRLSSAEGSKLVWQTGLFYYKNDLEAHTSLTFNASGAPAFRSDNDRHTQSIGVYGEATYPIADATRLTGGLRYDHSEVEHNQTRSTNVNGFPFPANPPTFSVLTLSGEQAKRRFSNVTYKARVERDLSADSLVYGLVATGVIPGDVQMATGLSGSPEVMEFRAETATSYEVGTKNRFADDRFQLNADLYFMRGDFQTNGVNVSGTAAQRFKTLSVPARIYGGEVELLFRPTAHDLLSLDYSYTHGEYKNVPPEFAANVPTRDVISTIPHMLNAAYTHTFNLTGGSHLELHGDLRYLSAHNANTVFVTFSQMTSQPNGVEYARVGGKSIGDLSATWTTASGLFSLTGYVRNVGDERYKTNVLVTGTTPTTGAATGSSLAATSATPYDPRTYGVTATVHF